MPYGMPQAGECVTKSLAALHLERKEGLDVATQSSVRPI